jgi:integrase
MAAYRKLPSGLWRAEVFKQGVRQSASFDTKAKAQAWATQTEAEIMARKRGQIVKKTLRQALERYSADVSAHKKSKVKEKARIAFFLSDEYGLPFVDKAADDVTADDLARWRDKRLKGVKGSTINRDLNLLSAVFSACRDEWGWCAASPTAKLRRPADPKPRTRVITAWEVLGVLRALDWRMHKPRTLQQEAGFAFLMSLHTGMRASEVLKARYEGSVAELDDTKNGDARRVPLSTRAQRLAKLCPAFTITGASLDALFRKARNRAGLSGFVFHDARATALTRMSKKVDVLQLAKISGHKDIKILSEVYYRVTAETIASGLR